MNPQLQSYIDQARAAGKSDEAIKQELRASGWQEPDLNQAFEPVAATAASVTTSSSGLVIGGTIAAVIILAIVGYLIFSRKNSSTVPPVEQNNTPVTNNSSENPKTTSANFTCHDVLPESDLKIATGSSYTDFQFTETPGNGSLTCSLTGQMGPALGKGYSIQIYWDADKIDKIFPNGSLPPNLSTNPLFQIQSVPNLGSLAYANVDEKGNIGNLRVLSTNKKYAIAISDIQFVLGGTNAQGVAAVKSMANIINTNLNKY